MSFFFLIMALFFEYSRNLFKGLKRWWDLSMYVKSMQKRLTYMGYYANGFARQSMRSVAHVLYPRSEERHSWMGIAHRVRSVVLAVFSLPFALALCIPAMTLYGAAACMGEGRFEYMAPTAPGDFWQKRSIEVLSFNSCLQDPWSPFTGGVVCPFESIAGFPTRIAAIVDVIRKRSPTIYMGQEVENLAAQEELIRLMKQQGFAYFLRDLGSNDPICNHSGLFVASKVPLESIAFLGYALEDRAGLSQWSNQGALTFTVSLAGKSLRFFNVHLNYGEGIENQRARNRQLAKYVFPMLRKEPGIVMGDLNFDTSQVQDEERAFSGLCNFFEGQVTCVDNRSDCKERIDGLIYDPERVDVLQANVAPIQIEKQWLSDHFAMAATIQCKENG